jgi:hypothetical protein
MLGLKFGDKLYRKIKARIVRRNMENIDIFLRL